MIRPRVSSVCKKQKSESTQTHKYTLSHMYIDMSAYFQTDTYNKWVKRKHMHCTVWANVMNNFQRQLHSLSYMQRHMERDTKTSASATILK